MKSTKSKEYVNTIDISELEGPAEEVLTYLNSVINDVKVRYPGKEVLFQDDYDREITVYAVVYETELETKTRFALEKQKREELFLENQRKEYERLKKLYGDN